MKTELISVIITVYNREDYINRCIDSVLAQKNANYEIIIVDDGSTDSSPDKCDEYASLYDNVRVIHQDNAGISAARNKGLDNAKGDYIVFLDDDDFLPEDAFYTLLSISKENDADLVIGNYDELYDDGSYKGCFEIPQEYCNKIVTKREVCEILKFSEKTHVIIVNWGKLYKKKAWDNVRFPVEIIKSEDQYIFHKLMDNCDRIYLTNKIVYHQFFTKKSITRSALDRRHLFHSEGVAIVIKYLIRLGYYDLALFKFGLGTRHLIYCKGHLTDSENVEMIKYIYSIYRDVAKELIPHVGLKNKIRFFLFRLNFDLYICFQKISGKIYWKKKGKAVGNKKSI